MHKKTKHYLKDTDLTPKEILEVLKLSLDIKKNPENFSKVLENKTIALLFEKLSLRTKFTIQIGVNQMGGFSVVNDGKIPDREPAADIARNLQRWVNAVCARVFSQTILEELAKHSSIPIINALSDIYHPCQILADMLTLQEHFGKLKNLNLTFIGDGNNVANSLLLTSSALGINFSIATPKTYEIKNEILNVAKKLSRISDNKILLTNNISTAVKNADAIYTDTWISMGDEAESEKRKKDFKDFQVTKQIFSLTKKHAIFMHCLPKHPNEEVSDEIFESNKSVVFTQAENRLHTIKALLYYILKDQIKNI